jgi:hypothetical protein
VTLAAVRAECDALDAPARARAEKNLALFDRGARLTASWGFPEDSRTPVWNRLIDGYRGTTWPLGAGGPAQTAFDPAKLTQGERWLEVRLPQPAEVARVVTLTAGLAFDVQVLRDGAWQTVPVASEETSPDSHESLPVRVAEYTCPPVQTDRVRLGITRDREGDADEVIFEVEVYGPEPAAAQEGGETRAEPTAVEEAPAEDKEAD